MEQAAYVVGKTKKTIYNHKDANKFSWETDKDGKAVIDASELIRVYGSENPITERLKELEEGGSVTDSVNTQNYTPKNGGKKREMDDEEYLEYIRLKEKVKYQDDRIAELETDKDKWQKAAEEAQKTAQGITLALEDLREKSDKKDKWEEAIEKLESKIANQDKEAQKAMDEVKKAAAQRIAKAKKELEDERNKGFFKKLFG